VEGNGRAALLKDVELAGQNLLQIESVLRIHNKTITSVEPPEGLIR
jgi:hypothetical protein